VRIIIILVVTGALLGCNRSEVKPPSAQSESRNSPQAIASNTEIVLAPAGDEPAEKLIQAAIMKAQKDGRKLLVYVGAKWCEPCKRFHQAVEAGQLDSTFPGLRFLEFDLDRDRKRLNPAGYESAMIPLFALPLMNGKASGQFSQGAIKGEKAVAYIVPRLKKLLEQYNPPSN